MIFSSVSVCMPIVAGAAASESYSVGVSADDAKKVVKDTLLASDRTASEALDEDIKNKYVDKYTNGTFTIYVNRYTGLLYYKNEITGQILTSNPTNPQFVFNDNKPSASAKQLLSQITVSMYENSNTTKVYTMESTSSAAELGQISVSAIKNGLRVNYAIGVTSNRYLLPNKLTKDRFDELFLRPFTRTIQKEWQSELQAGMIEGELDGVAYVYTANTGAKDETEENYSLLFAVKYIGVALKYFKNSSMRTTVNSMFQLLSQYSLSEDGTYSIVTGVRNLGPKLVIPEEHEGKPVKEIAENVYSVDGIMNFEDFCEEFEIKAESQSISIGGWVAEQLEKIPETGDSFTFDKLNVTVTETDNNRASLIEIKILSEDTPSAQEVAVEE